MDLEPLGWDGALADLFAPWAAAGHRPGRVLASHRGGELVATAAGELLAQTTGRLRHLAGPSVAGLPAAATGWRCATAASTPCSPAARR
jgi:hypothetical protein